MKHDEIASGAAGAVAFSTTSAAALYFGGVTGIPAAGVTSGLAAIGGSMVAGVGITAVLPSVGGVVGYVGCRALVQ